MTDTPARYRILESLGRGGMGEVFLADDTQLGRKVAIKFLTEALETDPTARERLHREARSAAALDHPFICKIHEITEIDGRTGIVMEHVAGETLESRLASGPLAPAEALRLASEVAEALSEAHAHRILHRDLKPANLMLTAQGHVKVMDFGLAKRVRTAGDDDTTGETPGSLTGSGALLGTPAYMAPEQVRGEPADARSDIFAFGVVLFELLNGEHPFKRDTVSETVAAILRDPPASADGSGSPIDYVIFDRLLAKTPGDRFPAFGEVTAEVERLRQASRTGALGVEETAPTAGGRRTPFVGRDAERRQLRQWFDQAVRGRGALALVGGEPGIGKTRLVEELLLDAEQGGCRTLTGRCYEIEGTAPFIPFVEIIEGYARTVGSEELADTLGDAGPEIARLVPDLRRRLPDMPASLELPPQQRRRHLFQQVGAFFRRLSRREALVLLLDDLHWADNATLLLLLDLAPQLASGPMLALGTYRDVDLDVNRPFANTLESLNRRRLAHRLRLRRLPAAGVGEMLAALGGPSPPSTLVDRVYQETEGNPFFVEEVYQHLDEEGALHEADGGWRSAIDLGAIDVPEGVRLVIGRRLERVSEDCRRVLTSAAVVGRGFSLALLEAVGDVTGDALLTALEEGEANFLITSVGGRDPGWEFSHALTRQTLTSGMSLPRRQRLHLRVADAIECAAGTRGVDHAADLAHHLFQAGMAADADRTVSALTRAGEQARDAGGFEGAFEAFDRALSLEPPEDDVRAMLLFRRGSSHRGLNQWDEAIYDWREALSLFETAGDASSVAAVCLDLAFGYTWKMRAAESAPYAGARPRRPRLRAQPRALPTAGATGMVAELAGAARRGHRGADRGAGRRRGARRCPPRRRGPGYGPLRPSPQSDERRWFPLRHAGDRLSPGRTGSDAPGRGAHVSALHVATDRSIGRPGRDRGGARGAVRAAGATRSAARGRPHAAPSLAAVWSARGLRRLCSGVSRVLPEDGRLDPYRSRLVFAGEAVGR